MTLRQSSSQQRIQGTGLVPQGPWTSASYGRANGIVTVTSVAHKLNDNDLLYVKPGQDSLLRTFTAGNYNISVVDEDTFTITGTGTTFIDAATTISYRSVRSLTLNASDSMQLSIGSGADEEDAVFITKSNTGNVRVGINNTNPEFDLDVEGQIRTTRSIISDTAQIRNLDVTNEFVTKGLDLRGPNLINFEETDPTAPDFGTIYYPTADNPPRQTQNNRIATTKFVYDVATADNGGRVYVSSVPGIGDDSNDGRSAAKPVRTIKKAAQIAYSLQQDTQTPEYVSIICSGGDYVEDNPISLPFNCSLIGDNLRRVILRPLNMDRHMIKASNETYCSGVVFRDHLDANGSPDYTWKYAYVFDDKQRLMYEPDLEPFEFSPGLENKGRNIFAITFENHTGDNTTLLVGYAVEGGSSSARAIIEAVEFTGPQASPYSSGTITVLMDDDESTFQLAERLYYADVYANIVKTGASPSDSLDVADRESQRPETEVIKHQRYQWVINSETETLRFDGSSATIVDATTNQITVPLHRLNTGFKVEYAVQNEGGTAPAGLTSGTSYFVRSIDENTLELYDTALNALSLQTTTGRRDLGDPGSGDEHTLFTCRISVKDNTFYFPKHGLFTGNGVYYRSSKAGDIGGMVNNGLYYVYKVDDNYFQLAQTQADATNIDISGADAPVILPITSVGKGYHRFEKAINVIDINKVSTDLNTQETYRGISFEVTGASRTIEGIPFVGHDYEAGQEVHIYGLPYTALDFGNSASGTYTQSGTTLTVTIANTDPSKMNVIWPTLVTLSDVPPADKGVGVRMAFSGSGSQHQEKSFHISTYRNGTLAQAQSDFSTVLGGSSNLGAGVARYNASTNEIYFVIRASDSVTRSGSATVFDNLGDFNGRKYVTHRIERADGYSLKFVVRGSCSKFATDFDPSGDQQVCSATNYALMSLRNSPYAFEKVEFGADFKEMSKQRDGAETINNNVDFIAIESYAHVKKLNNAGTSATFTRKGTYTCSGNVMTVVCPRGHGVFGKNAYSIVFSGATPDGSYIIDDVADHRTATIILGSASTDSGDITITVPAPWQTPNSVPPSDRSADGTSLILANKQFIAQEAVDRMLANNPSYQVPTGNQACIDDIVDYCEAMGYNLAYGGNDQVWDGAKYYVDGSHVVGEENESVEAFNHARDIAIQVMRNDPVTIQGSHGLTQVRDFTITPDAAGSGQSNKHADARNLIWANRQFIADIAVGRMNADFGFEVANNKVVDAHDLLIANREFIGAEAYAWELAEDPTLHVPTGNGQDCIDDIVDIVDAIAFNVQHGGNNKVWDAAKYYVGTPHLDDEEFQSVRCIEHAREICKLVLANNEVVVRGDHGLSQTFDLTITHDSSNSSGRYTDADCQDVRASVDTLFEIIHSAILNDSLNAIKKTTPRTFNVPSPLKRTAQDAVYNPATGLMTVTVDTDKLQVSAAAFTPASGDLELNVGTHSLTTNDKIRIKTGSLNFRCDLDGQATDHYYPRTTIDTSTISGAVYTPSTGVLSCTTSAGHGLTDGDWVRFKEESILFDCQAGTGSHAYPRDTDPVSGKWLQVSNTTGLGFDVNVAISPNTTTHTFVSAVANGLEKKRDRAYEQDLDITAVSPTTITVNVGASSDTSTHVFQNALADAVILSHGVTTGKYLKIATDSMTWTCDMDDGNTTHTYPRASDPANGNGWSPVVSVGVNTIEINVGPTNVDGYDVRDAAYNPTTGIMTANIGTNNFKVGQYMRLAPDSIGFTCTQDSNVSTKYYPRSAVDTDTVESVNYQPSTGVMIVTASNHGLNNGDQIKFADDSITLTCAMDGNATNHTYPRSTDYASDRWLTISNKSNNTFEVQVLGIGNTPSTNTSAHTFVSATTNGMSVKKDPLYDTAVEITAISDSTLTATNAVYVPTEGKITITSANHGLREDSMVKFADDSVTFTCDHDSNATNHSYPRAERKKFTVTDATYNTATGIVTCTLAGHGIKKGEYIKVKDNALSFSCTHGDGSTKTYPRTSDPISGKFIPVTAVTDDTFSFKSLDITPSTNTTTHTFVSAATDGIIQKDPDSDEWRHVKVVDKDTFEVCIATSSNETNHTFVSAATNGISVKDTTISFQTLTSAPSTNTTDHTFVPATGVTPTTVDYNSTTGWMTVTKVGHGLIAGDYIKVDQESIVFTCAQDSNVSNHAYPRPGDPIFNKSVKIERVTADTFEFNALQGTDPTNTTAHTFVSATTGCIKRAVVKSGGNFPHRFISATSNGVEVSGTNVDCKDDVVDILQVVSWNLAMGGNDFTYDAANMYVTGAHLEGEEHHSIYALREAKKVAIEVFQNADVTTGGHTTLSQVKDLTITEDQGLPICNVVINSIDTLMDIVEVAIDTGTLSSVSRTASYVNRCADVASSITTLTAIITDAIGTTGSPGNLDGVTRTYPISDDQCIDDIRHVLRSWMYDLRYGGNSKTIEAASKYILGTNINYVNNEVAQTRAVYQKAKDMAVLAIRNQLPEAKFTDIAPFHNASSTVDHNQPECGAAINALTALHTILDNALATPTSLNSVTLTEPSTMLKDDSGLKKVPMLGDLLDLPVIEASPYIQNASLISFLGGSGAEIDGAKVAEPNVPRPGVYTDANGRERATFPKQGKSMVANAFTIISVGGGVGYNILNDGYTQLVSVFVIFGGDGVIVQSGGYASLTNSASNFGTRALKATGFRSEAYEFDVGTVTNVVNQTDNNGAQTGRQIIEVGGQTLTNFPIEDYIIKFDGYTNTDPSKEYFILGVEKLSGSIGTQVTANITTNDGLGLSLNETATGTEVSFDQGNLDTLVGKTIRLHRPSVCNSSSHTWEYVGAGDTYLALPQNGGVGIPANEAVEEAFGQVYTSGTNEFGDFKVGDFVTIFNRTGSISFVGTVSISELSSIKIVGGSITITGFSDSDELGGAFASDSLLPTQAAVKDYITNKLGPYLNQPFSTNAVPSALVQLTTSGKINIEQIPALRPFNITSVASTAERLAIEDASAGDIAIETTSTSFDFVPSSVDTVNNYITIPNHGLATGDILTYFQGTANIGNLADGAQYYVIVHSVGANTTDYIKLATSLSDAQGGTARNLSSQGSGTHTLRTEGAAISYILENDLDSMFIAFAPDTTLQFTTTELVTGSATGAQGIITNYKQGVVRDILIDDVGDGYTGPPGITISAPTGSGGTQATATCTIVNGKVSTITITNEGSGYFTQPTVTFTAAPTGGTTATAQGNVARVEARLAVDLANNIKFSNVDFIQDEANQTVATGTYVHDTFDITVTELNHGFSQGDIVFLNFTSGSSPSGFYDVTPVNANEYTVIAAVPLLTSGNYERKKIVDVIRTVNTSANDASNWTQLSSTNIDASNIVAGTIDPERLADTGTANSFTFLRGDSSYQNVIQSIKFSTPDCMVAESSLSDTSYIEKVDITVAGSGYTNGTYQNIPMLGGNVPISDAGVARATYTVADVTTGGIIASVSNLNQTPESYTANNTFDVAPSTTTGAGLGASIRFTTDSVGTLSVDLILDGGSGYLGGDTLTFDGPLFGGTVQQPVEVQVSTLTSSQAFGVITSVSVVTPGTGYNGDFILTVPNELGTPSQAATLNARKGTLPRYFGNASIDVKKANKLTPTTLQAGGSVFGNYGIAKFRKNVGEQALGDQTEGGFIVTDNGEVSIDQGAGSELNADRLDGNQGAFYQNASNLVEGVIDPQRLANTTYNISISGTADFANVLFAETTAPSSANANLVSAANVGMQLALRSNNVNGIPSDAGGDRNGVATFRRTATGNSVAQLAFSATDNLYLRGNSDIANVYGNWAKIWHSENDGPPDPNEPRRGTLPGPNADYLDNQQGLWYQQGYNIHDQRTVGVLGDPALPTLLGRDKFVADNFYVVSSGEKYQLYIPNFFAATGTNPAGNLSVGGTYTLYADDAAVNNIGTITIDPGGITETDDTTVDAKYTVVTGSITFVGAYGNKDIRVFGPNPGSKWTVTSSNLLTTGASQVFQLSNTEDGALFEMGRAGIVSTPVFDVRSGGLSNNYDVRFEFSGGNSSNGNGLMDIKSSSVTINSNTVWHAGNDGVNSQLDAHYVDGYTQNSSNVANTLVRRTGSGDINISDLYADQGVFSNNGTSILSLGDGNGVNLGKSATHTLSIISKNSSSQGYIRFGNDSNYFGYNGTYLSYNNVYFRNGRLGIGDTNPGVSLQSSGDAQFGSTGRSSNTTVRALAGDSYQAGFEAYGSNQGTGYLYVGQSNAYGGGVAYNGDNSPGAFNSEAGDDITFFRRDNGNDVRVAKYRYNDSTFHFFGQVRSRVATGTAPFRVDSTTVCTNLNADLLDGYSATNLPYLSNVVNTWISDNGGQQRFYFANNSHTYFKTGGYFYFRNDADYSITSLSDGGHWHFHEPSGNNVQTSYRVQVSGDNGLDIDSDSVGLSSGQRSVVLRANGDKQWIDTYGIIKRNRQSISENITINNGDACSSNGPLTVASGYTIQIASGGSWVIL